MEEQQNTTPSQTPAMVARQMVADLFGAQQAPTPLFGQTPAQPPAPQSAPAPAVSPAPAEPTPPAPAPQPASPTEAAAQPAEEPATPEDKRAHAFASLRYENKQLSAKVAEAEQALAAEREKAEELRRQAADYEANLAEERRVRAEMEEKVGRANLAESKEFRDRYDSRIDKTVESLAKVISDKTDMTDPKRAAEFALKLLEAPEKDVLKAVENLPPYVQGSIYNLVKEGKEVGAERQEALEQWRVTQAGLSESEARNRAAELAQRRQALADKAIGFLTSQNLPAYKITDPDFVASRQKAEADAAAFIRTATEEEMANAAAEGVMAPLAYAIIDSLAEENERLREQLEAGHRLSAPPIRAGVAQPPPAPAPVSPAGAPPMTSLRLASDIVGGLFRNAQ